MEVVAESMAQKEIIRVVKVVLVMLETGVVECMVLKLLMVLDQVAVPAA